MNNNIDELLKNLGNNPFGGLVINFANILKLPVMIILFGNILFSILLFLRARILADTFESPQNGLIKMIVSGYLLITIVGSIVAVLFLLVG